MKAPVSQIEKSILQITEWLEELEWGHFVLEQIPGLEDFENNGELWTRVAEISSITFGTVTSFGIFLIVGQ